MIALWAEQRRPEGATVEEERATEKDPTTSRFRVADVMATWPTGRQTAFEVEYKNYTPEAWALKQSDYDAHQPHPIGCVWLMGHLRLKEAKAYSRHDDEILVQIPLLAQEWLAAGRPFLVVNPITRQIGTVIAQTDNLGPRHPSSGDAFGRLRVEGIDDCDLDETYGILTPTMKAIDAAEDQRRAFGERRRERARQEQVTLDQNIARYAELRRAQELAWLQSDLAAVFRQRWDPIPGLLNIGPKDDKTQSGVWAHPTHWRGVIYEYLIRPYSTENQHPPDGHDPGRPVRLTYEDIRDIFTTHGIRTHDRDPKLVYRTVMVFLERFERWRLIAIKRDSDKRMLHFEPTGYPLHSAERDRLDRVEQVRREREQKAPQATITTGRGRGTSKRPERPAPAPRLPPARKPVQGDRRLCNRCDKPLPVWQHGGYHTDGCAAPISDPNDVETRLPPDQTPTLF